MTMTPWLFFQSFQQLDHDSKEETPSSKAWAHFTAGTQLLFNFLKKKKKMLPLVRVKFALFYVTESKETPAGFPGEDPGRQAWTLVPIHSRLESPQTSLERQRLRDLKSPGFTI